MYTFLVVQPFEEFVAGHFRTRAYFILTACKSYVEGAPVGSVVHNLVPSISSTTPANSQKEFESAVSGTMNTLIAFFTKNGSTDCDEFRSPEIYNLSPVATANLEVYKIESSGTTTLTQV